MLLPTGQPKPIPRVQHSFAPETPSEKEKREGRLVQVKQEMERAWGGYRKYAWTHDELSPCPRSSATPSAGGLPPSSTLSTRSGSWA